MLSGRQAQPFKGEGEYEESLGTAKRFPVL
jgi:hypothetical protein